MRVCVFLLEAEGTLECSVFWDERWFRRVTCSSFVFSLATITKICSGAGVLVKPHIPLLAVALLESVTTLESQVFNYLSHFTASDSSGSETQEKVSD